MKFTWTRPYFGVQHMTGTKPGWQITVTDLRSCATCWIKTPSHTLTTAEETVHDSVEEAVRYAEAFVGTLPVKDAVLKARGEK